MSPATPILIIVVSVVVLLLPSSETFCWLVDAPGRLIDKRRRRREAQEEERQRTACDARRKIEEANRQAEAATSPAVEIATINDKLVKLAARKAELERRPDAVRH